MRNTFICIIPRFFFLFFFLSNRCTKLKKKDQIFPPYHSNLFLLFLFLSLVCCLSSLPVHIPPPHCPIQSTSPLPFMISLTHTGPITAPPPLALPPTICSPPHAHPPQPPQYAKKYIVPGALTQTLQDWTQGTGRLRTRFHTFNTNIRFSLLMNSVVLIDRRFS